MAELITNGDFAAGDTGWTLTGSAAVITTEDLRFPDAVGTAAQASIFSTGATYSVSIYATGLAGAVNTKAEINVYNGSSSEQLIGTIPDNSSSDTYTFSVTATSSDGAIYITSGDPGEGNFNFVDDVSVTQTAAAAATGGGGPRRKIRRTAIIDGKEIQVSSFEEAQRLFQHFNKTTSKPTKKSLRFKVIPKTGKFKVGPKQSRFKVTPKKGISIKRK